MRTIRTNLTATIIAALLLALSSTHAQKLGTMLGGLTQGDASAALKEALSKGVTKSVDLVSVVDGYFGNPEIKIPMPADAEKVEKTLRRIGMGRKVDEAVLAMNRAAESAAKEAAPIFLAAIKGMTIKDAVNIVKGDSTSATRYLEMNTTPNLTAKFRPIIAGALEKTSATRLWKDVMSTYNKVPFVKKVNADLPGYVTGKAIEGLFTMISKEEVSIRQDPAARTTDLLKKVFGL